MSNGLFIFPEAQRRRADVEDWFEKCPGDLGLLARHWFNVMRACGDDVTELLHDLHPTACVNEAAFGYVNAFTSHVNVGFFRGAELSDPQLLLAGSGKLMRHVKLTPGKIVIENDVKTLIEEAYKHMKVLVQDQKEKTHEDDVTIGAAAPCFIVRDVPETLAFYRDKLGFDVTFEGPEPGDIFFGIVERGRTMIMFKSVDVEPVPNYTRDIGHGVMSWDAYVYVPDPDTLALEFSTRGVEFHTDLGITSDNLRGFEIKDVNGYILFFGRPNA